MDAARKERGEFVAGLANTNREFYDRPQGRGMLRALELTFKHRWVYIFELIQNALDASARSIAIHISDDGDALIFQHDGTRALDEGDVEALSMVFRSTKGASTVGFMGVGFKSVFMRFQEARISGWGWTFRYEIAQIRGEEYGDVQTDLLGAVVPIWDGAVSLPEPGFTTRFELSRRTDQRADLESDLARFLPDNDRTPLAILAASNLKRLEVNGCVWELGVTGEHSGSLEATALSEAENRMWQLFSTQFQPSKQAIACFLEHRKIRPAKDERDQVYADAGRPRQILGVLPLDNEGLPAPPSRGSVYATLPTEVTLPFGLHVNADWLLDLSRSGLRGLEGNPWQRGIADGIVEILAQFLEWSADTLVEPHAAKIAFQALALPSTEASGLEALLAEDDWLSRLRDRFEDATVIPVWTAGTSKLAYAKPRDALVPPDPLAKAFRAQPDLQPAVLLKGSVLRDDVLGRGAVELLGRLELRTEMLPRDLEHAWEGGLEDWWETLPDNHEIRRHLLFHIWAAVADLGPDDAWTDIELPCIRSVTGQWLSVSETTFLNEPLPTEHEPGGRETRQFMQSVIQDANRLDEGWVSALRQGRQNEPERVWLSQVWDWVEDHAHGISLQDIVKDAVNVLVGSSANPDWSVLLPLGHWAKHRNRPGLLTYVLVESESDLQGVPISEALLANPYVEHGQDRRQLFPAAPAIAAVYFEDDPKSGGTYEWRVFFEKAHARGKLQVQPLEERCWRVEDQRVAEFLDSDVAMISESNDSGYLLLDFDIEPSLPDPDAPEELRKALATWLDDGLGALKQMGKRKASYFYYSKYESVGNRPSAWASKLAELAWVPCDDGKLRCPQDALPTPDPVREDAPVAQLSPELLSVLDQEGLEFGTAIPEATSLRRLLATGTHIEAEELAQLISDCREQVMTDADLRLLEQALQDLRVPSDDGRRIPLKRIVQRVGGRRGALGGWIVPLDRINETLRMELQHPDFPSDFPETTTGEQSLDYILEIWKRARSLPEGLANEVRDVLPMAYAYCLEDCEEDTSLHDRWTAAFPDAIVFAEREWIVLAESDSTYLDDIEDKRFFPGHVPVRIVTAGHLGRSRDEQFRTADAISVPLLSSVVTLDWRVGDETAVDDNWISRFDIIHGLLLRVRQSERAESDGTGSDTGAPPALVSARKLAVDVRVGSDAAQHVPVNARLHRGTLTVAGRPVEFGADAAKELLREFSFGQRANLAADLTGMLSAIGTEEDFRLSVEKFAWSHVPGYESTDAQGSLVWMTKQTMGQDDPSEADDTTQAEAQGEGHPDAGAVDAPAGTPGASDPTGNSYPKGRALAKPNSLVEQLKSSLKGEIAPSHEEDGTDEPGTTNRDSRGDLGDEEYREAAAQYEREADREPELGNPRQTGWDIRSVDPKTSAVRLIEVKGKGRSWDEDEVVELSRAQVREAFKATDGQAAGSWYLYVVEKTADNAFHVLPIENPAHVATRWILSGRAWRWVAEDPKHITVPLS